MCLQCCTEAESFSEVIPGWALMRATKDAFPGASDPEWRTGEWGLIQSNDPDYIFDLEMVTDPTFEMSDQDLDDEKYDKVAARKFDDEAYKLQNALIGDPLAGYRLIEACIKAGWDGDKHGYRISHWLLHKMALHVMKTLPEAHDDSDEDQSISGN